MRQECTRGLMECFPCSEPQFSGPLCKMRRVYPWWSCPPGVSLLPAIQKKNKPEKQIKPSICPVANRGALVRVKLKEYEQRGTLRGRKTLGMLYLLIILDLVSGWEESSIYLNVCHLTNPLRKLPCKMNKSMWSKTPKVQY